MKKLLNKKGFTLMEMMIVIAIIVILIAIAVPNFNNSLEKANKATDDANLRAAKAAAVAATLEDGFNPGTAEYYYDMVDGKVYKNAGSTTPDTTNGTDCGSCDNHTGTYISITYTNGVPTVTWSDGSENCD